MIPHVAGECVADRKLEIKTGAMESSLTPKSKSFNKLSGVISIIGLLLPSEYDNLPCKWGAHFNQLYLHIHSNESECR